MLRLEKSARDPENTALKAPASKNLCNVRVNCSSGRPYTLIFVYLAHMRCNINRLMGTLSALINQGTGYLFNVVCELQDLSYYFNTIKKFRLCSFYNLARRVLNNNKQSLRCFSTKKFVASVSFNQLCGVNNDDEQDIDLFNRRRHGPGRFFRNSTGFGA